MQETPQVCPPLDPPPAGAAHAGDAGRKSRRLIWALSLVCAVLYFLQGLIEPVDGLGAQPVRSLLKQWGRSPSESTAFIAWASMPWSLKFLYGPLVDLRPLWGSRRRSYLLLTLSICAVGMLGLYFLPPRSQLSAVFLLILVLLTVAVAVSDVAGDALMVEIGQPLGLTGRLQSIQWTCLFIASSAAGYAGGWLSLDGRHSLAFLICGVLTIFALLVVLVARVPEQPAPPGQTFAEALRLFVTECRSPAMLGMAAFLFLWTFNPYSQSLLYLHLTQQQGFGEIFYGKTVSYMSIASTVASAAYGFYCHRLSWRSLLHGTIILGVISNLAYCFISGEQSVIVVTWFIGFTYQTAVMMQLDLAARTCPIAAAGTCFAVLMALCNLSGAASTYFGGALYQMWLPSHGAPWAFSAVLVVGMLLNLSCYLLWRYLRRGQESLSSASAAPPPAAS